MASAGRGSPENADGDRNDEREQRAGKQCRQDREEWRLADAPDVDLQEGEAHEGGEHGVSGEVSDGSRGGRGAAQNESAAGRGVEQDSDDDRQERAAAAGDVLAVRLDISSATPAASDAAKMTALVRAVIRVSSAMRSGLAPSTGRS